MPETNSTLLARLREYRTELLELPTNWPYWSKYETWAAKVRPFLRRHFPQDLQDFEHCAKQPEWHRPAFPLTLEGRNPEFHEQQRRDEINCNLLANSREKLVAFMDTLVKETSIQSEAEKHQPALQFVD